jgi:curli biogenesis system outer membrane secretion channel CsgG
MKTRIMLLGIVSGRLSANAQAATKTGDLPATVVRAGNREIPSHSIHAAAARPISRCSRRFNPLTSACKRDPTTYRTSTYRTRGDSSSDCLTTRLAASHAIQVNRTKHVLPAPPSLDRPTRTAIESPSGV